MTLDPSEPCPYGIGSDHWPGVGKVIEEMSELGTVFGKFMGSSGQLDHWSGDLGEMMDDEIGDLYAALDFLVAHNGPALHATIIRKRRLWKRALFAAWQRGDPKENWPRPQDFGLPPIQGR